MKISSILRSHDKGDEFFIVTDEIAQLIFVLFFICTFIVLVLVSWF